MAEAARQQTEEQSEGKKKRGFEPCPGCVVQAFTLAMDPGAEAEQRLPSHCGAARTAFNWARDHVFDNWDQRAAEASYGIGESERNPCRSGTDPAPSRTAVPKGAETMPPIVR